MKTESNQSLHLTSQQKIKQIEEELKDLKHKLEKYHLTKSSEQDYEIKSHIIEKQNELIELLIEHANKTLGK